MGVIMSTDLKVDKALFHGQMAVATRVSGKLANNTALEFGKARIPRLDVANGRLVSESGGLQTTAVPLLTKRAHSPVCMIRVECRVSLRSLIAAPVMATSKQSGTLRT